jgi:hypothetical protein
MTSEQIGPIDGQVSTRGQARTARLLAQFLDTEGLAVLDVVAGAAPGTRRLYVGARKSTSVRFAVSMPLGPTSDHAVDDESRVLSVLRSRLPRDVAATTPREVEQIVGLASSNALVVTAVPGLGSAVVQHSRRSLDAAVTWLTRLWGSTAAATMQVQLGQGPFDTLLERSRAGSNLGPLMLPILRARQRLAEIHVSRTVTHGCLCARHLHHNGLVVTGVDDWSLGAVGGDPVRDLGRFAVGAVAKDLPETVSTRTHRALAVRSAVSHGLEALSVPPRLWRDVLLLAQFELAVEELGRGSQGASAVLEQTVQALPART